VKGKRFIPWGERILLECNAGQAAKLMRWSRRYVRALTGKKYNFSRTSMNVFINDSAQWLRVVSQVVSDPEVPF
jgi:hypothetical protein